MANIAAHRAIRMERALQRQKIPISRSAPRHEAGMGDLGDFAGDSVFYVSRRGVGADGA